MEAELEILFPGSNANYKSCEKDVWIIHSVFCQQGWWVRAGILKLHGSPANSCDHLGWSVILCQAWCCVLSLVSRTSSCPVDLPWLSFLSGNLPSCLKLRVTWPSSVPVPLLTLTLNSLNHSDLLTLRASPSFLIIHFWTHSRASMKLLNQGKLQVSILLTYKRNIVEKNRNS